MEPGPIPTFSACLDQIPCAIPGRYVSCDYLKVRELFLDHGKAVEHVFRMAVGAVKDDHIHLSVYQCPYTIKHVCRDANPGAAKKPSLGVFCREPISLMVIRPARL